MEEAQPGNRGLRWHCLSRSSLACPATTPTAFNSTQRESLMLESSDPSRQDLVAAELRKVLLLANKMTIVDSAQRQILFELTKAPIHALLQLNETHYQQSDTIRDSIASLASALLKVRNLGDGTIETLGHEQLLLGRLGVVAVVDEGEQLLQ